MIYLSLIMSPFHRFLIFNPTQFLLSVKCELLTSFLRLCKNGFDHLAFVYWTADVLAYASHECSSSFEPFNVKYCRWYGAFLLDGALSAVVINGCAYLGDDDYDSHEGCAVYDLNENDGDDYDGIRCPEDRGSAKAPDVKFCRSRY